MGYVGPETMFVLSPSPEGRDALTSLIEEALQLRMQGLTTDEIEDLLARDVPTKDPEIDAEELVRFHLSAWKNGVKSLYYLRSTSLVAKKRNRHVERCEEGGEEPREGS